MLVIAFLGMGKMGRPMAYNLASAGFRVRCWNRTPEKASRLLSNKIKVRKLDLNDLRNVDNCKKVLENIFEN